ncbi:MAG: hypothetical protein ACJ74D_13155 [Gaiellaceae bacterium]
MSAEQVALIPQCEECREVWLPGDAERWHAHWVDDGPDENLIFYWPDCAAPEFQAPAD